MHSPVSIAVITDAHGNALALEAVLEDVRRHAPDLIVNLGDQVWGQVDPLLAYELQAGLGAIEVRGNNDEKPCLGPDRLTPTDAEFADWLSGRVPREYLERLNSLPTTACLVDDRVLVAHGTPASPWENLLWRLGQGALLPRDDHAIAQDLADVGEEVEVVIVGHTHQERVVKLGSRLVVNGGPVSWQTDGDPRARWTLVASGVDGWRVESYRVEYDWGAAHRAVLENDPVLLVEAYAHSEAR